jgi:hypothetical protein
VKDDARSGRPSTARTDENVESVRRLLTEDRRTTLQMIADRLNIGKETVYLILPIPLCVGKLQLNVYYGRNTTKSSPTSLIQHKRLPHHI